jgi:hypothetical protein
MSKRFSRRDFRKFALAGIPLASFVLSERNVFAQSKPNSDIDGVHIGVITYSFGGIQATDIIPTMVQIGLSNVELISNHAESLAGLPQAGAATSAVVADVERQQVRRRSAQTDCFLVARTCRWWSIQPPLRRRMQTPRAEAQDAAQGAGAVR